MAGLPWHGHLAHDPDGRDARAAPIRTHRGEGADLRHHPGSSLANTQPATSKRKRTLSPLNVAAPSGARTTDDLDEC